MLEITTLLGRKTHCAMSGLQQGLPPMHALLPKWVMEDLCVEEYEPIRLRCVNLECVSFVRLQALSKDFATAVHSSGKEARDLLNMAMYRLSALTEDTTIPVQIDADTYHLQIVELQPRAAV